MIELNGLDEIAEWLDQREMYIGAHMIKRRQDEEAQGLEPTTYLGLAMAAPVDRGGQRPMVTGATEVPVALPASGPWAGDPVPMEEPLGFSIDELPALGGAGSEPLHSAGIEVSAPQVSVGQESDANAEQR
jgi:hypothetical protein